MCARFKSPFKKSSFNFGMRMLERHIIKPSLKLGSAAIKEITSSRKNSYRSSYSHNTSYSNRSSIYSLDAQEKLNKRNRGLEQCKPIRELIGKLTLDDRIELNVRSALLKIYVALNKYYDKGVLYGSDFFSFADSFCSDQITNLKTDKSKWEYGIAKKTLSAIQSGYTYENLVQFLQSIS